jgi:glc operon protein GlcG
MALPLLAGKKILTLAAAKKAAEAAEQFAIGRSWSVVIAITDDGGNLIYLQRMDNAPSGSVKVAQDKAHTSAMFKAPTGVFESALASGLTSLLKLDILPFEGGLPLAVDGTIVGAIGVSGCAMSSEDGEAAQAGVDWFSNALAAEIPCNSAS